MASQTVAKLLAQINKLDAEEFKTFQAEYYDLAISKRRQLLRAFRIGQLIEFTGKFGVKVVAKVTKINSKNLAAVEVKINGNPVTFPRKWRVAPSLCKAVE